MQIANKWCEADYRLIDTANGEKLEKWGDYLVIRPDPQVMWPALAKKSVWDEADMHYHRTKGGAGRGMGLAAHEGHGYWEQRKPVPKSWEIAYKLLGQEHPLRFRIRPTDFKHMGLFPEQAVNWEWMAERVKQANRPVNILNLFAYTGGASCACASAGASVCHVEASKGMNAWAKENATLSGVADRVRFITDDVMKFVQREKRRNHFYDGIVMDPPSYGRGPSGEVWKIEDNLFPLVDACTALLSQRPLFFLINSYTTGFSPLVAENILKVTVKRARGAISSGEIGLSVSDSGLVLPCGIYGRWESK